MPVTFALILFHCIISTAEEQIDLNVNEQRVIHVPGYTDVYAVDRNIVSLRQLPNRQDILLTGKSPGSTSITILFRDGRTDMKFISVHEYLISLADLKQLLGDMYGIDFLTVGSTIAVKGNTRTQTDRLLLDKLSRQYGNILNLTEDLSRKPTIQMDVKVVEVSRGESERLGIEWFKSQDVILDYESTKGEPLTYSLTTPEGGLQFGEEHIPPLIPGPEPMVGHVARLSPLVAQLNLLLEDGRARVLAKPKLLAEDGGNAHFLVGGEIPYQVSTIEGYSVAWKEYGTSVDIAPGIIAPGIISVKVTAELSELDWANAVLGAPGLKTRSATTRISVRAGETIAFAGLLSSTTSIQNRRIPVLGYIPLLGNFFTSTREETRETETVIFITPYLIDDEPRIDGENISTEMKEMEVSRDEGIP
jgi:pilus assembly protein CpaC